MSRKPDRIWTCPQCSGTEFQLIVSGAESNQLHQLVDVLCVRCGHAFRPSDPLNRIPTEYFRELETN